MACQTLAAKALETAASNDTGLKVGGLMKATDPSNTAVEASKSFIVPWALPLNEPAWPEPETCASIST
jgi:hypothetical protein